VPVTQGAAQTQNGGGTAISPASVTVPCATGWQFLAAADTRTRLPVLAQSLAADVTLATSHGLAAEG
jgi:hypothetical protein